VPALNLVGEKARVDVMLGFTADAQKAKAYDPETMNLVEKVTAFKLQTRALNSAKMGDAEGASKQLRAAATRLLQIGEDALAEAALEEAQNLEQKGAMSSGGTKKLHYATRRLTRKPSGDPAASAGTDETDPSGA
jgi:Ca-activated chloride channel family protein